MTGRTTGASRSPTRSVRLDWTGAGLVFNGLGTEPGTPAIVLDGDGVEGPSPMIALLLAAASCSASDVVLILEKMRANLVTCSVEVQGTRREEDPRRYVAIHFTFRLGGSEFDYAKAERAVDLSLGKYCSVVHTLAPDVVVTRAILVA